MSYTISYVSYRTSKKRLLQRLKPFGKSEFSKYINPIVANTRKIPIDRAIQVKYLRSDEVIQLLEMIGEPIEPFGKTVVIEKSRLSRHQLSIKVPFLSSLVLRRKIIKIMMELRGIDFMEARTKKILHSNEVVSFLSSIGELDINHPVFSETLKHVR